MSHSDKVSRILLFLLVIGVWGLLLRPLFLPAAVQAQAPPAPQKTKPTAISVAGEYLYLYQDGKLYVYGFDAAIKRRQELAAKGFVHPAQPDETRPSLLTSYELAMPTHTK